MTTLALAVVLWLVGFDIIYALQDYEFDKSHGLRSLVVAWGQKNALAAAFSHTWSCAGCYSRSDYSVSSASRISLAGSSSSVASCWNIGLRAGAV